LWFSLKQLNRNSLKTPEHALRRLRRVREVTQGSLAEARHSMWTLSGESFENADPAVALAFLAQKLFAGSPIQLQLHLEEAACRLTPEMSLGLFRIGKEALVNVWRHGRQPGFVSS
jgi:signal transduction histidine kinase